MKFSLDSEQRSFFNRQHAIEFEGLLSEQDLLSLNQGIAEVYQSLPKSLPFKEQFLQGRDLWRKNEQIRKVITHHRLVSLVYELVQEKPIRLGFDQFLPQIGEKENFYTEFFKGVSPFQNYSAIQDLLCMAVIYLNGEEKELADIPNNNPFPAKPGSVVFFSPDYEIDFQHLASRNNQSFLLVGFTRNHSQYLLIEDDPQRHFLKKLGYVFGDKLHDNLHPVLLR